MKSTIKLFRALPIADKMAGADAMYVKKLMGKTVHKGFIFAPEVIAHYSEGELMAIIDNVCISLSGDQMNKAFHKSWEKVGTASEAQLVMEQMIHYLTTYGFESLGFFSHDTVYIPNEKLEVPGLKDGFRLVVIKGYSRDEIEEKLMAILESGVALAHDTVACVLDIAMWLGLTDSSISKCKNKEVRIAMYEYLGQVPANPVEFLRYVIYKATGKTLLIKNQRMIDEIKKSTTISQYKAFETYEALYGLDQLATIFLRFKPLFLAFRRTKRMRSMTNTLRRLAKTCHRPMPEDLLNNVTAMLKRGEPVLTDKFAKALESANTFRKIRLAYALSYRMCDCSSILYKIRNGKGFATQFDQIADSATYTRCKVVLSEVLHSITDDVRKNVAGKKVHIPPDLHYALPATEKQFSGMFPSGTYVSVPKDMIFGVHWKNVNGHRIDLDLSLMSIKHGKIGWDRSHRSSDGGILFSGDITDAPEGATELFYVKKQIDEAGLLMLNYFNYDDDVPVPFQTIVAHEELKSLPSNYMVDPNNLLASSANVIDVHQKVLGLLVATPTECRFYFSEASLGLNISARNKDYVTHARNYLVASMESAIDLRQILVDAGALMCNKEEAEIDLSPEALEKDSIIKLLY